MSEHSIEALVAMGDAELGKLMGHAEQIKTFRTNLKKADALKGKARTEVQQRINKMFEPRVYPDEIGWMVEDAKRSASKKELADASPASVMD